MAKVEFEVPEPPEGYEYTGEIRRPLEGELYFHLFANFNKSEGNYMWPAPILRKKRWRAECGEKYIRITSCGEKSTIFDHRDKYDDRMWLIGNYFKTEEQADDAMIEILKFWENYQPIEEAGE